MVGNPSNCFLLFECCSCSCSVVYYYSCSICVSGVCLTATELDLQTNQFKVGLAPETLRRTYFAGLQPGDAVNLERASEIGGRNSGHFVQGHVDGMGTVLDRCTDEDSVVYKIIVDDAALEIYRSQGIYSH
jgi:riboflavin synthase